MSHLWARVLGQSLGQLGQPDLRVGQICPGCASLLKAWAQIVPGKFERLWASL
jgi:hypothetical protein